MSAVAIRYPHYDSYRIVLILAFTGSSTGREAKNPNEINAPSVFIESKKTQSIKSKVRYLNRLQITRKLTKVVRGFSFERKTFDLLLDFPC